MLTLRSLWSVLGGFVFSRTKENEAKLDCCLPIGFRSLNFTVANARTAMLKGFVCPKCRLLFSVESGMIGEKVTCKSCAVILQIPSPDDGVMALQPNTRTELGESIPGQSSDRFRDNWLEAIPEELSAEYAGKLPWHMIVPAGVVGLCCVVYLFMLFSSTESRPAELNEERFVPAAKVEGKVEINKQEALLFYEKLAAVKDVTELHKMVIPWDNMEADMRRHYSESSLTFPAVEEIAGITPVEGHLNYKLVAGRVADGSIVNVILSKNSSGELLLDWKLHVGYCSAPWGDLAIHSVNKAQTVRAFSRKVEYYNYGFSSDEWQSYELTHPKFTESYIGYARRGSLQAMQLSPLGGGDGKRVYTLNVYIPSDVGASQLFIIKDVLKKNWLTVSPK